MLLSKLFSSRSAWSKQDPESTKIRLPTEIWIHIWSFLDFNTLQKISILVSKEWFCKIRNSARLSGEMILRLENRNAKDINNVLFQWPKLKVLHLSDCQCGSRLGKLVSLWEKLKEHNVTIEMLGINLTENALLEKIIVPKSVPVSELGGWGKATKVWFDPKNWNLPHLRNVIELLVYVDCVPKSFEMVQMGQGLINVEDLYISAKNGMDGNKIDSELIMSLRNFILGLKKLKIVSIEVEVDITDFLEFLHSIANIKDVKFWLNVCIVHDDMEEKYVEGVFEEAFKIVDVTFPIESTDVGIGDIQYDFKIDKKYNQEPELHEDSEFHLSDSDESSDDEESTENDENSSVEEFEDTNNCENSNNVTKRICHIINIMWNPILWLKNKLRENLNY